jgi:hypothetical protein
LSGLTLKARRRGRWPVAAVCALTLLACGSEIGTATVPSADLTFPRTLGLYLDQDILPGAPECFPNQHGIIDPSILGRYDQVVLDMEWSNAARLPCNDAGTYGPNVFAGLRNYVASSGKPWSTAEPNRGITIIPYVNPVDRPSSLGSNGYYQFRYDLWGCKNAVSFGTCSFPIKQWAAHTTSGTIYTEFSNLPMANLTDAPQTATISSNTSTPGTYNSFAAYFGRWLGDKWNSLWSGYWDGVYLDVWGNRIWNNTNPWDPFYGGPNEAKQNYATDTIYADPPLRPQAPSPTGLWQRGIAYGNATIHKYAPSLPVLVANNTQSPTTAPGENGRLWESFADPALGRQWSWDVPSYVDASGAAADPYGFAACTGTDTMSGTPPPFLSYLSPTYNCTGGSGTRDFQTVDSRFSAPGSLKATDFRRARYDLAATLLGNGYWGPATGSYAGLPYFDEMDGGTLHTHGYLGAAIAPNPTYAKVSAAWGTSPGVGSYAGGTVFRRDFQNGIALVNSSSTSKSVPLGSAQFHRLTCTKNSEGTHGDLSVDNGATATGTITIPGTDGLILLNGPGGKAVKRCGS